MSLNKKILLEFLEELDKEAKKPMTIVAVGGTAMTLVNAKPSTLDVDFTIAEGYDEFSRLLKEIPHGFKVDHYPDGVVFTQMLPDDYVKKSKKIKKMKNITLMALDPLDIIVTKIGRLNDRDTEDIKTCIKKFKITKSQIKSRAAKVGYAGNETVYQNNLNYVLKNFF